MRQGELTDLAHCRTISLSLLAWQQNVAPAFGIRVARLQKRSRPGKLHKAGEPDYKYGDTGTDQPLPWSEG